MIERIPKRQALGGALLGMLLCAILGSALWGFHARAREYLDHSLGLRLQQVASTAAATVPGDSLLVWWLSPEPRADLLLMQRRLERIEQDNQLSRIVVYQPDQTVVVDSAQLLDRGEYDPFLALDLASVEQARSGLPAYSRLQDVDGLSLKAGYAPVFDGFGEVAGMVGVVGSASFLETLAQLQRTLWWSFVLACGLILLTLLAFLAYARRLARARQALQRHEQLSAMGRMAAGIAHEIRNPLGIIKNTAQLLREDLEEAGQATDLLDYIPEEVDRLNETLTGYLEFAQERPLRCEEYDVARLLSRTLRVMGPDFDQGKIRLKENLPEVGQLQVEGDPRRMQQVFLNLFLNSIQAMPEGGQLDLVLAADESNWDLRIQDSGKGIAQSDLGSIFEPFVTSREKGSGLGLPTSRRIVEEHGGSLRLESEGEGKGTVARLRLPRRAMQRGVGRG